jgi:hypothetical protein
VTNNGAGYATSKKKIMNISEFLEKKRKFSPQIIKSSKNNPKSQISVKKIVQNQKNRKKIKKSSQNRQKLISVEKPKKPNRRIEVIRSPPIKKKFINWLRKEESSGKWIRQAESPLKQLPDYAKGYNIIQNVSPQRHQINSPKSQISLKHSLKATIRTPSKTTLLRPKIINKSRSQIPNKNYSISPKPTKTRRSKRKYIQSKKNLFFEKADETLYGSVYDNKPEKPYELDQFRSCQNHRQIDFTPVRSNSKISTPLSNINNPRFRDFFTPEIECVEFSIYKFPPKIGRIVLSNNEASFEEIKDL